VPPFSISEHRVVADRKTAALVRPDGTIDWWCSPRFDAPPLMWSLLDPNGGESAFEGVESLACDGPPAGATAATVLRAACGIVDAYDGLLDEQLIRLVRCRDGDLDLEHRLSLGGFEQPCIVRDHRLRLTAPRGEWVGIAIDARGEHRIDASGAIQRFGHAERRFAEQLEGVRLPRRHIERGEHALAVLHACSFEATGATVASPTTSVPEAPGHDRQFDYRYAWLRDNALASSVASLVGRPDVAAKSLQFLASLDVFHAPLFTVAGRDAPDEREVAGVCEHDGSSPIRVGNQAKEQLQYDALGLIAEAVSVFAQHGGRLDRHLWRMVSSIADRMCDDPDENTNGIWEQRDARPFVSADIGRWLALDRAIWMARLARPTTRRRRWIAAGRRARERVLAELRPDGRLPREYGGSPDDLDASALLIPIFGMLDARDERAHRLVDAHIERLGTGPFMYRYGPGGDDGFSGVEGVFIPCCWWAVAALAAIGRIEAAEVRADELCRRLPLLLGEEFDPMTEQSRGNVPLVWSHVELARAMHLLDVASIRRKGGSVAVAGWRLARFVRGRWEMYRRLRS
jgi:hypothetical protein